MMLHSQKVTVAQYSLHKGDHIPLSSKCNSIVPADVVLIRGQVLVDEQELTGERIVVCKNRIPIGGDKDSENSEDRDHVVFRGTRIVDRVAIGRVIRTGNDCEMYRTSHHVQKPPNGIQNKIMLVSICNLYLLLLLSTIGSLTVYYYEEQKISLWQCWKGLILLLNTIIPLSLYFCYRSASWILAKKLERQFNIKIQPHGTCSFQNQINSICTDKTGTLSLGNTLLYKVAFQFQESSCVQSSSSLQDKPSVCQILAAEFYRSPISLFIRKLARSCVVMIWNLHC